MTEIQLRQSLVSAAKAYLGALEGGDLHLEIVNTYNAIRPLPLGYTLKVSDSWCAAFVSAAAAKAKLLDIIPPECSCPRQIAAWQKMGRWMEDDDYVPAVGDYIYYDWQDDGRGDNRGNPDHVGIITNVSGNSMSVIEGNVGNSVKYRYIAVNAKNIRGYGLPDYASKAEEEESVRYNKIEDVPQGTYRDAVKEFIKLGIIKGRDDGSLDLSEDLIRGLIFGKRYADKKISELSELAAGKLMEKLAKAFQ